jgi:hypothetical protein
MQTKRALVEGTPITITGSFLRIAGIKAEEEHFYDVTSPERIVEGLRAQKSGADLFTFWQRLPNVEPRFGYCLEWDNVAAVRITTYEEWLKKQVHVNTRNKIKKAAKCGIEVRSVQFDDTLVKGIVEIFNESSIRQGRPFAHFGEGFEKVKEEWSSDSERSEFVGAYLGEELVGFIKLLYADRYARTSGTICKLAHRDKAPMNALIAKVVELCAKKQLEFLIYGKFSYGKKGTDSLSEFKKHNGFEEIQVPRYYIPLTAKGRLALSCGVHKGLLEALPHRLVRGLLSVRGYWYKRRSAQPAMRSA